MAFQPVGNGAEVCVRGLVQGEVCNTTLGFLGIVGFGAAELDGLVNEVRTAWTSYMLPNLCQAYTAVEVTAKGLRTESDNEATLAFPGGTTGALGQNPMPNNVSLAIAFKTGFTGRSNRGRNFWPILSEDQVSGNTVAGATITAILAAYTSLRTDINSSGDFLLCVISRQLDKVVRPVGVCIPVTSFSVANNIVDSMRRRLPGRGV